MSPAFFLIGIRVVKIGKFPLNIWTNYGANTQKISFLQKHGTFGLFPWLSYREFFSADSRAGKRTGGKAMENRETMNEEEIEKKEEESEKGGKTVLTTKHVPGDISAMGLWLKNRSPERWRDHPEPAPDPYEQEAHDALVAAIAGEPTCR